MNESSAPPSMVKLAGVFYLGFTGLSLIIGALSHRPWVLFSDAPPTIQALSLHIAWGAVLGVAAIMLSRSLTRNFAWARELVGWFHEVLGPITWSQAFALALFSSVGEEMLFRGALQPLLGLTGTSILFGLVHWPTHRGLWPWTVSAGVLGFVFGAMVEHTGNLAAPITAHFLINFVNLRFIGQQSSHEAA